MFFASTMPPMLPILVNEPVQSLFPVLIDIGASLFILLIVLIYFKVKDPVK